MNPLVLGLIALLIGFVAGFLARGGTATTTLVGYEPPRKRDAKGRFLRKDEL